MDKEITQAELQIMKVLWAKGECTAQQLFDTLGEVFEWKLSTVKTLIGRLVKKKYVIFTQHKKEYLYQSNITEFDVIYNMTLQNIQKICAKKRGHLLYDLLKQIDLDEKQYQLILNMLQHKENIYPTIECNCLQGQCSCKQ